MRTILHIEDDVDVLDFISSLIEEEMPNTKVVSIDSPSEGEAFLLTNKVDAILCDIKMPDINGMIFLRNLSLTNTLQHPFVFYSGYLDKWQNQIDTLRKSGTVDSFIAKPDNQALLAFLKDWYTH